MNATGLIYLIVTIAVFWGANKLYQRTRKAYLTPLLVAPVLLMAMLYFTGTPVEVYSGGTRPLTELLQPATVAFAIPLYRQFKLLRKHAVVLVTGVLCGSVVAVLTSVLPAGWIHASPQMIESVAPRSITTPIAMEISRSLGGIPSITAVFVVITGVCGSIIGPLVIRSLHIRSGISRGLLLGMGAHGAGTSKARELGSEEGAVASVAMILAALFTLGLIQPMMAPFS
ncbi:LrgB family protein [Paenibacillus lutrae]|uniref:CidB/LrgB family autolysis modulator n=1 Tax=Paenibacillus lutrae TaxID=2078573 RepID=A0A7X3FJ24_9BACL|nr:LrgB family protein [Paenibacillus lutrae]MVP00543.1 CidB/LrgB family autolysis modulator [Paenibacillus lutrae]